jgi:two-component system response regulator
MKEVEILLVEDDPDDAELTIHAFNSNLEMLTRKLFHVKDGVEAIEFIFGQNKFAEQGVQSNLKLIILDLKLPKLNGLEVLRAVREDPRTKMIPAVMLTSSKEKRDVIEAYELGINSYIVKPLSFDIYVKTVASIGDYWMLMNQPLL